MSGIYFYVVHPDWTSIFDNTKWQPGGLQGEYGTWTGTLWEAEEEPAQRLLSLTPINGWEVDFRPLKMRITMSQSLNYLVRLYDSNDGYIYNSAGNNYSTGDIVDLSFSTFDIDNLYVANESDDPGYNVTNIEFFI